MAGISQLEKTRNGKLRIILATSLFATVACQTPGNHRQHSRLSLDGSQLSMLERTGVQKTPVTRAEVPQVEMPMSDQRTTRKSSSEAHTAPRNQITSNSVRPILSKDDHAENLTKSKDSQIGSVANVAQTNSADMFLSTPLQTELQADDDDDTDAENDETALVDETEKDAEKEILDADSARSPEEMAELLQNSGIEGHFALCEGSVYMDEWQRIFDGKFVAENKKRFRSSSKLQKALVQARSEAYTKLLLPSLSNLDFDYPVVFNEDVIKWVQYFQTRGRRAFVTWLRRAEDVIPQSVPVLEKFGLPKDLIYLAMIESGFNNKATSIARAAGTWQFMRATGRNFGLKLNDYVDERRDPEKSTVAAARYLTYLYTLFGDWHLASASYNAGEGRVARAMRGQPEKSFFALSAARRLPNETRNYVPKLIAAMLISKNPTRFGFDVSEGSRALRTRGLPLEKSIRLADLSSAIGVDLKVLESINPELRLGVTPPGTETSPYLLRVPESSFRTAVAAVEKLPQASRSIQVAARVKRRETVGQFANRYGISLTTLMKANPHIQPNNRLAKGQTVMIPVALGSGQYERLTREDKTSRKKSRVASSSRKKNRGGKIASRKDRRTRN